MPKDAFSEEHLLGQHSDRLQSAMGDAERLEWRALVQALRQAVEASVGLDADVAAIAELRAKTEALADALAARAPGRGIALFGGGAESPPEALSAGVPFSPVMGQLNPIAPPLVLHVDGDRVVGTVSFGAAYEGAPGLVHGGVISAVYDEVLALACTTSGGAGPTGRLTTHFRRPTPLRTPLRFEAWTERIDERKSLARGRCLDGETLLTEAEGLYIRMRR
jgi:acyl-coenzyme A thioesterase PaaI-like protein